MTLEEALAVMISIGFLPEPTQEQRARFEEARLIVDQAAAAVVARPT